MQPIVFPHKTLDPVSGDRVTDLAAGGDADPARGFGTRCPKNEKAGRADLATPFREPEKIGPPEQALVFGKGEQRELPRSIGPPPASEGKRRLLAGDGHRQTLAPFGTAALDDESAVLGGHADTETVSALPGSIAGLKGSFAHMLSP